MGTDDGLITVLGLPFVAFLCLHLSLLSWFVGWGIQSPLARHCRDVEADAANAMVGEGLCRICMVCSGISCRILPFGILLKGTTKSVRYAR